MVLISISGVSAQEIAKVEFKEFDSKNFPFKRPYPIITPEDYDTNVNSDYDVIYVFDSQWRARFGLVHDLMHYGCQELMCRHIARLLLAKKRHWFSIRILLRLFLNC